MLLTKPLYRDASSAVVEITSLLYKVMKKTESERIETLLMNRRVDVSSIK
jgi:hypothetical protein